ncbi:MAG: hypothetical protein ABI651_00470 [Verrucomicrobiota bacterium]
MFEIRDAESRGDVISVLRSTCGSMARENILLVLNAEKPFYQAYA